MTAVARRSDSLRILARELATYVGECCPELEVVEVRTVIADGSRLCIRAGASSWEPGHKRLGRDVRRRRSEVRVNVGIKGAITRQIAAFSWTELLWTRERIADTVTGLVVAAVRRLSSHDNKRRRAEWSANVEKVMGELAVLPAPPVDRNWEPDRSAATWDIVPCEDEFTDAISPRACGGNRPRHSVPVSATGPSPRMRGCRTRRTPSWSKSSFAGLNNRESGLLLR